MAPRSARIGYDREVGVLVGIEIKAHVSVPELSGKPLAMIPSLDGGTARLLRIRVPRSVP
jgi:hypothetical protein